MKPKLLLFQIFLIAGILAQAQNDTIKTLIISEAHLGNADSNFLGITNMESKSADTVNNNALLSSITWPDIPDIEMFIFEYGWKGDTIPGFSPFTTNYHLKLPPHITNIPATVVRTSDINAKVEVQRATFLFGTQEERTTTYTVTATDDTTKKVYSIEWQPEPDSQYIQPPPAEPSGSETDYLSTITSEIYKVSPGYSFNEQIRGLIPGVKVSEFLDGLIKKDENQLLIVRNSTDGNELSMDDQISNGDTLVVTSANGINTSKYLLDVTDTDPGSNTVLTSALYDIIIEMEPTDRPGEGAITGFEYKTTLKTILKNIQIPAGATLTIIDSLGAFIPLKVLNYDTVYVDATVNRNTYFEIVAEDGVTTINYQLQPQSGKYDAFIFSDYFNVIQSVKLVRYVPLGITVSNLLSKLVPSQGASVMVVDKSGFERTSGYISIDDEIVVTSKNLDVRNTYFIGILGSGLPWEPVPYLAYLLSDYYSINQVINRIFVENNATGLAPSIDEFIGKVTPLPEGATLEVIDVSGNGILNRADTIRIISPDGRYSTVYFAYVPDYSNIIKNNIKIYPNPTTGEVYISGLEPGGRIQVINITGVKIRDIEISNNIESISMIDQPAGIYLIRISDANSAQVGSYKLMKR